MHLYLIHQEAHNAIGVVEQKMKEVIKFLICEEWLDCGTRNWDGISLADKLCIEKTDIRGLLNEFETYSDEKMEFVEPEPDEEIEAIIDDFGFSVEKITLWNSMDWFHNNTP